MYFIAIILLWTFMIQPSKLPSIRNDKSKTGFVHFSHWKKTLPYSFIFQCRNKKLIDRNRHFIFYYIMWSISKMPNLTTYCKFAYNMNYVCICTSASLTKARKFDVNWWQCNTTFRVFCWTLLIVLPLSIDRNDLLHILCSCCAISLKPWNNG